MTWRELWERLATKELAPCYLLYGEEEYLIWATVGKIEVALNLGDLRELNYERLDARSVDAETLAAATQALPWLVPRRLVVLAGLNLAGGKTRGAGEDEDKGGGEGPGVERDIPAIVDALPASTCLVLVAPGGIDNRRRAVKAVAAHGVVQEFPRLKGKELEAWLQVRGRELGLKWGRGAVELLAVRAGPGLGELERELEKLVAYAGPGGRVGREEVALLVPEAGTTRVFDLLDAVLARQTEKSLAVLDRLLKEGESPLGLVALLARQVRLLGVVKEAMEKGSLPERLAAELKLHPHVARKLVEQSRGFSWDELYLLIQNLAATDEKLKTTGLTPRLILEELLFSLPSHRA